MGNRGAATVKTYGLKSDILVHGNEELKEIALTIDDGPRPDLTREFLNVLGSHNVRATFFVVGKQVNLYPGLVRRMINEGHEVANHTHTHERLPKLTEEGIRKQIAECNHAVLAATGSQTNLFRPPGMEYNESVLRIAQELGYVTVHWNVAAQDYQPHMDPKLIARKILAKTSNGSVILLHNHPDTLKAMPEILDGLTKRGYRFVTVSQMLGRLPRPVYVRTNSFAPLSPLPETTTAPKSEAIAKTTKPKPNRPNRRPLPDAPKRTLSETRQERPSVVDVPTWQGH